MKKEDTCKLSPVAQQRLTAEKVRVSEMNDTPYIHTFRTSEQCYVYDVNTDKILKVPQGVFNCLSNGDGSYADEATISFIQEMKANGFLRSDRVEVSEHPATPLLPYYLKNKMRQLILQVTQKCNLRCDYCVYSGTYKNREHSHLSMSSETAERLIDFFIKRTKDSKNITVSFYGGEPLLNFKLIKHCVNYIETRYYGRNIEFAMTTNGTVLDENIIAFLAEKNVDLLISLDGPKEIHDTRRRFASNNEGSYSVIMDNIARIKELHPEYYKERVRFNAVSDTTQTFSCFNDFILGEEIFKDESKFMLNYISNQHTEQKINMSEDFIIDREYEYFKVLLSRLGELARDKTSYLLDGQLAFIYMQCHKNVELEQEHIPHKFHHSGPCIPGASRLFADINGRFFPCERVSELSETVMLGDIKNGISLEKIIKMLNLETATHSKCKNCWAYRQCTICIAQVDDMQSVSESETYRVCPSVCKTTDEAFKDYCTLRELGYNFDEVMKMGDIR